MPLRVIIQFLVILIGVAFEAVRTGQGEITPFLISDQGEWFRSYVYNFIEHLKFITISVMMWAGSKVEDYENDRLFVVLAVLDFIDYLVMGNNLWWSFTLIPYGTGFGLVIPMSMNVLSLIVFGLFILIQWNHKTNG
jgi:hypothetical protein